MTPSLDLRIDAYAGEVCISGFPLIVGLFLYVFRPLQQEWIHFGEFEPGKPPPEYAHVPLIRRSEREFDGTCVLSAVDSLVATYIPRQIYKCLTKK